MQHVLCTKYSLVLSREVRTQPIGDTGDSGAMITPAVIISTDPPSQPPPTWARTSEIYSGSVRGREAGCEVMEMTLGI